MRRSPARAIGALAALALVLGLVVARPAPVTACSGAEAVTAAELLEHQGPILVVRVVQRNGRVAEQPRSVVLGLEEALRGSSPSVVRLDRPRQAIGVCHDLFTGWVGARMLLAMGVRTQGYVLMPAWRITRDGALEAIYDDEVPWPTLDAARTALGAPGPASAEATVASVAATWPVGQMLLAATVVLAVIGAGAVSLRARRAR